MASLLAACQGSARERKDDQDRHRRSRDRWIGRGTRARGRRERSAPGVAHLFHRGGHPSPKGFGGQAAEGAENGIVSIGVKGVLKTSEVAGRRE